MRDRSIQRTDPHLIRSFVVKRQMRKILLEHRPGTVRDFDEKVLGIKAGG